VKNTGLANSMCPKYPGVSIYVCPSVGQIVPGSNTPIRGSNNPPITGLLFIYVSREVTSTTEFLRISSGDNILN